ncbi:MAG: family 20 glycosylhydrolase [Bacteroidales bacterium]|nr:family 20 glycosylhydrolase [Bacteroidales bacterium]MBN2818299.1 family 20 glycosylhydrolase [Bacteroidales bacterium]
MERIIKTRVFLVLILTMNNCTENSNLSDYINISWAQQFESSDGLYQSTFEIKNTHKNLDFNSDWILYFSMAPRHIKGNASVSNGRVFHINGDYFKLIPDSSLIIKAGEKKKFTYYTNAPVRKYCDAPRGLFFVLNGKKESENTLVQITNYQITPFSDSDLNYKSDPAWQYSFNNSHQELPKEQWQPIIPKPNSLLFSEGNVYLNEEWDIIADSGLEFETEYLIQHLKKQNGISLLKDEDSRPESRASIELLLRKSIDFKSNEDYSLIIKEEQIIIQAGSRAGVLYGIQSILSLAANYQVNAGEIAFPKLEIKDSPRFTYRGLHMDVCRNFQTKKEVLKVLEFMSVYKLNRLQLYLTEDEGWRIEIKSIPELTEVGSKRGYTPDEMDKLNPAYGSGAFSGKEISHGTGYYSQEDFIEILKFADQRNIRIIPSINFPGHARAAIKAMEARYQKYIAEGDSLTALQYRLASPGDSSKYNSAQFYNDNVVDVSLESVYNFFEKVVDEVIQMYEVAEVPLEYIFTGGDEVPEGVWTGSQACLKLAKNLGLDDPKNLQAYFLKRIREILQQKGVEISGWEEVALKKSESGNYIVNPEFAGADVTAYVWNNLWGNEDLGYKLANANYPVVLCFASNLYFDLAYNDNPLEPGLAWAGYVDEYDPWVMKPLNMIDSDKDNKELLRPEYQKNIKGIQAQLWAEIIEGPEMLEYLLLPKLLSLSERAWASQSEWAVSEENMKHTELVESEWNSFYNAVTQKELPRLVKQFGNLNYRVPPPGIKIENNMVFANAQYPGSKVFYTTDGSEPGLNSEIYSQPVKYDKLLKFITIDVNGKSSRVVGVGDW